MTLDEALKGAGLDPEGVRSLFLDEAVADGVVIYPAEHVIDPEAQELMAIGAVNDAVDALLEMGCRPILIKMALAGAMEKLSDRCKAEFMKSSRAYEDLDE